MISVLKKNQDLNQFSYFNYLVTSHDIVVSVVKKSTTLFLGEKCI